MIITFILFAVFNFILFLIGLLPNGTGVPADFTSSISTMFGYLTAFNAFFPMATLFQVLIAEITMELAIVAFHVIEWIYHKIRGR